MVRPVDRKQRSNKMVRVVLQQPFTRGRNPEAVGDDVDPPAGTKANHGHAKIIVFDRREIRRQGRIQQLGKGRGREQYARQNKWVDELRRFYFVASIFSAIPFRLQYTNFIRRSPAWSFTLSGLARTFVVSRICVRLAESRALARSYSRLAICIASEFAGVASSEPAELENRFRSHPWSISLQFRKGAALGLACN